MDVAMLLDYLAIRLNGGRAAAADVRITLALSDPDERHALEVANGVLNHTRGRDAAGEHLRIVTTHAALLGLLAGGDAALQQAVQGGQVTLDGGPGKPAELVGLLDEFEFCFPIVTP